jgi:outer membrane receptor protein involved in Fe transport
LIPYPATSSSSGCSFQQVYSTATYINSCSSRDADDYVYYAQQQFLNIGSIRNQGWELQGSVNLGPFVTRGTYSWTKSRVIGITPKYRALFATKPEYSAGATFRFLPEHTWAMGVSYAKARTNLGVNLNGVGSAVVIGDELYYLNLTSDIRLQQNLGKLNASGLYVRNRPGYTISSLNASHRMSSHIDGVLQIQNLMDAYHADRSAGFATMGRQSTLGLRLRF